MIDRLDMNGKVILVDDILLNRSSGKEYRVVFSKDILAYGIVDSTGFFGFMSDWIADDWEVIGHVIKY